MRFRHLHSMAPRDRMAALEEMFPVGERTQLFAQCAPGEYERLLRGIPSGLTCRWSDAMTEKDRAAWFAYRKRTDAAKKKEDERLALLGPPLFEALKEQDYDIDDLLALPRLLGDPLEEKGVRLYFLREAFPGAMRCYERTVKTDELAGYLKKQQFWGSAPFVALHDIPYGTERSNAAALGARVFVADWDTKKDEVVPEFLSDYPPDLLVRSGGGFHAYWKISAEEQATLSLTHWRRVNLALARRLGSDPNVSLGSQIMRLPGSFHLKDPEHPKRVVVVERREGGARSHVVEEIVSAFKLELLEEEYIEHAPLAVIDVDPEEHPALARVLEELQEQGLMPQADSRGWVFYCPCHEIVKHENADLEDGTNAHFTVRQGSTPSGILRVSEDKSLKLFCGSTGRCGAGPRAILEALGLSNELTWLECGGFLHSEFGKRFKAAKVAAGTWEPSREERKEQAAAEARVRRKASAARGVNTKTCLHEAQARLNKLTPI